MKRSVSQVVVAFVVVFEACVGELERGEEDGD